MGSGNVIVLFHALQNRNRKEESYHLYWPVCEESALCLPNWRLSDQSEWLAMHFLCPMNWFPCWFHRQWCWLILMLLLGVLTVFCLLHVHRQQLAFWRIVVHVCSLSNRSPRSCPTDEADDLKFRFGLLLYASYIEKSIYSTNQLCPLSVWALPNPRRRTRKHFRSR